MTAPRCDEGSAFRKQVQVIDDACRPDCRIFRNGHWTATVRFGFSIWQDRSVSGREQSLVALYKRQLELPHSCQVCEGGVRH